MSPIRGETKSAADTPRRTSIVRLGMVLGLGILWLLALAWRLLHLQVERHDEFRALAQRQQELVVELDAPRGALLDARGRELAVSVEVDSVFVDPSMLRREGVDLDAAARDLAAALKMDPTAVRRTVDQKGKFVWLRRKVEPAMAEKVRALELPGVSFLRESRRDYPMGMLAAQVLGYVGTDEQGLGGLESKYDEVLRGKVARRTVLVDGRGGRLVAPEGLRSVPSPGGDLHLTLDAGLQHLVESELRRAVSETRAEAGIVVLLDPRDSAVLAMATVPSYDPNRFREFAPQRWRNRAVMDAYEPGSTFKMLTAAAVLESLAVHPDDRFDCEMGGITLGQIHIGDHKPFGVLTFREIIARSSNVGVIKAALRAGVPELQQTVLDFGFGQPTGIDLPGESSGILRQDREWGRDIGAYASFGHGLSVTPMQLANAYAALANGGTWHQPYVVRAVTQHGRTELLERPAPRRIDLSPATVREVVRLLEGVVEGGSGAAAALPGYRAAGKTGTAQKSSRRGYSETGRLASFVGFAPSRQPRLVALVMLDEPRGRREGGAVAAPVFARIVQPALVYLGTPPVPEDWGPRPHHVQLAARGGMPSSGAVRGGAR